MLYLFPLFREIEIILFYSFFGHEEEDDAEEANYLEIEPKFPYELTLPLLSYSFVNKVVTKGLI